MRRRMYPEQLGSAYGAAGGTALESEMAGLALNQPFNNADGNPSGHVQVAGSAHPDQRAFSQQRIDPNQIPSPVAVQDADQLNWCSEPFRTRSRLVPPLESSDFGVVDEGNCSPRFIRLTTYSLPTTEDLLNQSGMPLGAVIQPLADVDHERDAPIQLIHPPEGGAVRCRRCRAYINPFINFIDGGRKFVCNFCRLENDVPSEYFCNLDMNCCRTDLLSRPELLYGTIEYYAGKEFSANPPQPAAIIIALEITVNSLQSGLLEQVASMLRAWLYPENGQALFPKGAQLGIITYGRGIHFYDFDPSLEEFKMLVVSDIDDMFVPLSTGFVVDPFASKHLILQFLDAIPSLFEDARNSDSAFGSVAKCLVKFLSMRGGRVVFYHTSLPTIGPGALKSRDDARLYGTDKEKTLYQPQDTFYKGVASEAIAAGVSFDLNLFPSSYIDVATIGVLSAMTSGECNIYPQFNIVRDGVKVYTDGLRLLSRNFGYNALMRIRTSAGLRAGDAYGNFYTSDGVDLSFAAIDADKAMAVTLRHDGTLSERYDSAIQVALLYTTTDGVRVIRVQTLTVANSSQLASIFRFSDLDTTVNYLAKLAISSCLQQPLSVVRSLLLERCVKVLSSYRAHCSSTSAPGQLILPENFKLFPLFTLGLHKCLALRVGEISSDLRVTAMRKLSELNVLKSIRLLYPKITALHLEDSATVRASLERLEADGLYLFENGQTMFLWVGRNVSQENLRGLFGVDKIEEIDLRLHGIPPNESAINMRVQYVLQRAFRKYQRAFSLQIVRQGIDQAETEMLVELVEDASKETKSYVDFLVFVHHKIHYDLQGSS